MTSNNDNRNKLLAALLTLLMGAGIVGLLFVSRLHYEYPPKDAKLQQMLQDSIIFGGEEYVELEDLFADLNDGAAQPGEEIEQENDAQQVPDQESGQDELQNKGVVDEPAKPPVATKNVESPMKVEEKPRNENKPQTKTTNQTAETKKQGPTTQNNNKTDTKPKPASTPSTSATDKPMQDKFKGNNGNTPGGEKNGTAGRPSVGGLGEGYTLEYFPTKPCPGPGTVVVKVVVSPTGKVTKANVVGGSLRGNARACEICRGLALGSTFRVSKNNPVERSGTLTYTVQ